MSMAEPVAVATGNTPNPYRIKVYRPGAKQWWISLGCTAFVLASLPALSSVWNWFSGGPIPSSGTFKLVLGGLFFALLGIHAVINVLRGFPRLTVTPEGIKFESTFGTKWARWNSLDSFMVRTTQFRFSKRHSAIAKIVGPNASRVPLRRKTFSVPDLFQTRIDTMVDEINAERALALGTSESLLTAPLASEAPDALAVGLVVERKLPLLTLALLAVLLAVFVMENQFPVSPGQGFSPSVATLLAMGGLSRAAVLSNGEWYRLFTAPLLHGGIAHIALNGVALLVGGLLLERLVGRLWFFAFFVIGALGGSLLSLAVGPANQVSVGASGALMGMFAALLVGSFRLPAGTPARQRLQVNSLQVLIPSLLPLFSAPSLGHIDYGAHFGGALSGAALAAVLLKFWPQTERFPRLRAAAAAVSILGAILFVASAGIAAGNYPRYNVTLIPSAQIPATDADRLARAAALVAQYPGDPRSHFFFAQALATRGDNVGAERELRTALTAAPPFTLLYGPKLERGIRAFLAAVLLEQGKRDDANEIARPVCAVPAGDANIDNVRKMLTSYHICS
jgi:rhomboid protease GluP